MTHKPLVFLFLFWSILQLNSYSQVCFVDTLQAKVTPQFEVFDNTPFENEIPCSEGDNLCFSERRIYLNDSTFIYLKVKNAYKYYAETPKNNLIKLIKRYYPNGNIKEKGLHIANSSDRIGMWYYFDESGNLTDSIDYTKDYSFTLCQFLDYIKDLTIYDIIGGTDKQNLLPTDYLKNRLNKPESISYFIDKNTHKKTWGAVWNFDFNF